MERYEKLETLGQGQFGTVVKARNIETGELVAVKKVRVANAKEGIHMTALREIKILKELRSPRVVRLIDVFLTKGGNLALVLELMASDLEAVITDRSLLLSLADIKAYTRMALEGLEACHAASVVHRDIKPNNLLTSESGELKLADFGLAKICLPPDGCRTAQVFARWYRAPELLWGSTAYGTAVDVWALGCVLAELALRRPWFAADSDITQLAAIFAVLGTPTTTAWPGVAHLPYYVEFTHVPGVPLENAVPQLDEAGIDLLGKMVCFDPAQRISAADALKHPWFTAAPMPTPAARLPRPRGRADAPLRAAPSATDAGAKAAANVAALHAAPARVDSGEGVAALQKSSGVGARGSGVQHTRLHEPEDANNGDGVKCRGS